MPCRRTIAPGLPMPRRRTFATAILSFAHSMLTALARSPPLRHPAYAGQQRRLSGHGQPLTVWWSRYVVCAIIQRQARRAGYAPADGGRPRKNRRMRCFSWTQLAG